MFGTALPIWNQCTHTVCVLPWSTHMWSMWFEAQLVCLQLSQLLSVTCPEPIRITHRLSTQTHAHFWCIAAPSKPGFRRWSLCSHPSGLGSVPESLWLCGGTKTTKRHWGKKGSVKDKTWLGTHQELNHRRHPLWVWSQCGYLEIRKIILQI